MELFGTIIEMVATLLDGAKIRQVDHCMDVLVKEGLIDKGSPQFYELKEKMR